MPIDRAQHQTRVLFVDDEANVLSGLRRMLRGHRDRWELHFALGGPEAIQKMQSTEFDVIISDMRMPEMDGVEVLRAAKTHAPLAMRCVLSGQADREQTLRVLASAHQFASKPCDTDVLEGIITRSESLQRLLVKQELRGLVTSIHSLPVLPEHWNRLQLELTSEHPSIEDLAETIASDLGLAAKVLQLVNSSFFGQPKNILCPRSATKLLGSELLIELAIHRQVFPSRTEAWSSALDAVALTKESLVLAQSAYDTAWNSTKDLRTAQESYLAGMFHGVGKIVLAEHVPDSFALAVGRSESPESLLQNERELIGADHLEIGASLLTLWGFPSGVVNAVLQSENSLNNSNGTCIATQSIQKALQLRRGHACSEHGVMV